MRFAVKEGMPVSNEHFINLDGEFDQPIYRIFNLDRVEEILRDKTLVLVKPELWEDPFENFLSKVPVTLARSGGTCTVGELFKNFFGQCWTQEQESDAMWRIYSPKSLGGRMRTTPRRLIEAIYCDANPFHDNAYFIGKVQYFEEPQIVTFFQDPDFTRQVTMGLGWGQAHALLLKRTAFAHEKEVRLLFNDLHEGPRGLGVGRTCAFTIAPNALFDEITLDPRLDMNVANDWRNRLNALGFGHNINRSNLYAVPAFTATINL